ncbi:hypothetical protein [Mesorhizobium sp. KR2-14]|uniref:hypothetical protein n=1 Tax=Mesorhizobium sp. KR2-14 TaxID=3156610 RepID=UPI0032B3BB8F
MESMETAMHAMESMEPAAHAMEASVEASTHAVEATAHAVETAPEAASDELKAARRAVRGLFHKHGWLKRALAGGRAACLAGFRWLRHWSAESPTGRFDRRGNLGN